MKVQTVESNGWEQPHTDRNQDGGVTRPNDDKYAKRFQISDLPLTLPDLKLKVNIAVRKKAIATSAPLGLGTSQSDDSRSAASFAPAAKLIDTPLAVT